METIETAPDSDHAAPVIDPVDGSARSARAKAVTRNYMWWAMGAGLVPFPIVDLLGVAAVQIKMIEVISGVYDVKFSENRGKSIIASLIGSIVANSIAHGSLGSLVKFVPVLGGMIGALTMPIFAGATTYSVGKVFIMHFEAGGTLLDFDPAKMSHYFHQQFEEGKQVAEELHNKKATPPAV